MRAFLVGSSLLLAFAAACSLTTNLDGLSGGAEPGDASVVQPPSEGGPLPEASPPADARAETASATPYADAVLADGPVAYYRFEDPEDSNSAKDELGAHPATVTQQGIVFGSDGVAGSHAVLLDGKAGLDVGDAFDFAGRVPFTLEIWVKPTTSDRGGHLIHKRDESVAGAFKGYILYTGSAGDPHFEGWGVDLSAWNDTPLPTAFAHVVLSVSYATGKGNATLYIDAQPTPHGGFDNVIDLADTPQHLVIGRGVVGVVDEVAIYGKALPPDRVLAHYRAGKP